MAAADKKKRGKWFEENMKEAIKLVQEKKMTQREASEHFKLPRTTLRNRYEAIQSGKTVEFSPQMGRFKKTFSKDLEKQLVLYVKDVQSQLLPLNKNEFLKYAYNLAEQLKLPHQFNRKTKSAGKQFYYSFVKRHPELSLIARDSKTANADEQELQDENKEDKDENLCAETSKGDEEATRSKEKKCNICNESLDEDWEQCPNCEGFPECTPEIMEEEDEEDSSNPDPEHAPPHVSKDQPDVSTSQDSGAPACARSFWSILEDEKGVELPTYIKNILSLNNLDNPVSFRWIDDDALLELEEFARSGMKDLLKRGENLEAYFGRYHRMPEKFRFLIGDRFLVKELVALVRSKHEDFWKSSSPTLPFSQVYLQELSEDPTLAKPPDADKETETLRQLVRNALLSLNLNEGQGSKLRELLANVEVKVTVRTVRNRERKGSYSDSYVCTGSMKCVMCPQILVVRKSLLGGGRRPKWVTSNYRRHVKFHLDGKLKRKTMLRDREGELSRMGDEEGIEEGIEEEEDDEETGPESEMVLCKREDQLSEEGEEAEEEEDESKEFSNNW